MVQDDRPFGTLPVVDVSPLLPGHATGPEATGLTEVARQIEAACREHGFFYVTGHGVAPDLLARLTAACAAFFALPQAAKMEIAMARGGPAWRGYFPVGAELTSGRPDLKEGLYFGAELGDDDSRVRAGLPLHGRNLFPRQVPELRAAVLSYIGALTDLGQAVLRGVALSLGLDADYFAAGYTASPTVLYTQPADAHVATFVGDANLLPCTIVEGRALTAIGSLDIHPACPIDDRAAGTAVVRPEHVHVTSGDRPRPHRGAGGAVGVLTRAEYYGHDARLLFEKS